jgi:serine-type D-Ala-D-Ala carboxypeptidase/endopeptidase (penicillin-binding protein 4)
VLPGPPPGPPPVVGPPRVVGPPPAAGSLGSRRLLWVGLAAGLVVLLGLGVGLVVFRPAGLFGPRASATPAATGSPVPSLSPVLAAAPADAPLPGADAVAAALAGPLDDSRLGNHVAMQVIDVATGQKLFTQNEADSAVPASTMKLTTAVAALARLGGSARLPTRAVAGANPGEVVLVGGGDPTLAVNATGSYPGAARLDDLAGQVKKALDGVAPTKVVVDSSLFTGPTTGPNWEPGVADSGGYVARVTALMTDGGRTNPKIVDPPSNRSTAPDLAAGQAFARLLGLSGSAVSTGRAPLAGSATPAGNPSAGPKPGTRLGEVSSPPVLRLVEEMLQASDNTIAEVLARHVAISDKQPASFAGAGAAILSTLTDLGLPTVGVSISDGSGLSFEDRLTPQLLTGLLAVAARPDRPALHGLVNGLPVAGYSGTLADRFRTPNANPADGLLRAKTGTLPGINSLAGYVTTASGRLLAFAVLADRVTSGILPAEAALDRIGTALASLS